MIQNSKYTQSGFTIIEILMVITIISIMAGIAVYMSGDFFRSNSFNSDVNVLGVYLQRARSQAISNIDQSPHGVKIIGKDYVIFEGVDYNSRTSEDPSIKGNSNFTYTPADTEVVFDQLSGNSSFSGNIIVFDGFKTATISLNLEGRIDF